MLTLETEIAALHNSKSMKKKVTACLFLCFTTFVFTQNLSDGLLLHYNFNDSYNDVSGNDYHGTNFGTVFTEDRFGNQNAAALFDGIDDFINFPNSNELKPQLPLSFSFWIRYDSDDWQDREVFNTSFEEDINSGVFFNSAAATGQYGVSFGNGAPSYTPYTRTSFLSVEAPTTGKWTHIAIVIRAQSDMNIYVNCVDTSGSYSGSGGNLVYSNLPGTLGRHDRSLTDPANYFKGAIDDFRYWERALTQDDVTELCTLTLLSTDNPASMSNLKIFPNPSTGFFYNRYQSSIQ